MNDRDKRVVENMFQSGMEKETVYSLFPQFPRSELEKIGERFIKGSVAEEVKERISINCS